MTAIKLTPSPRLSPWRIAQVMGVVLTIALIASLVWWPTRALHLLWDLAIPLLPAVFLINPVLWRNVCPLATLNNTTALRWGTRAMGRRWVAVARSVGILLLVVMIPARRFLFNTNGPALALTIAAVAALAMGAGLLFARRAGFCNSLCPLLPVEKLYGQSPLIRVGTARCSTCPLCTPAACIEVAQAKAVAQTLGPARRHRTWLLTPFGVFAAAFPGFIIGYFTSRNGSLAEATGIYATVLLGATVSYLLVATAVVAFSLRSSLVTVLLGGASVGLYYWFAAEPLATSYGGGEAAAMGIRVVMVGVAGAWTWRAVGCRRSMASAP